MTFPEKLGIRGKHFVHIQMYSDWPSRGIWNGMDVHSMYYIQYSICDDTEIEGNKSQ